MIMELSDIIEDLADKIGIYGEQRSCWVSLTERAIRQALETERKLDADRSDQRRRLAGRNGHGEAVKTLGQIARDVARGPEGGDYLLRIDHPENVTLWEAVAQAVRAEVLRWKPMSDAPKDREIEVKRERGAVSKVTDYFSVQYEEASSTWKSPNGAHYLLNDMDGWRDLE